jgi:Glycine rich protein family
MLSILLLQELILLAICLLAFAYAYPAVDNHQIILVSDAPEDTSDLELAESRSGRQFGYGGYGGYGHGGYGGGYNHGYGGGYGHNHGKYIRIL